MTTHAGFKVSVSPADATAFAELSGDWNPLHTDPAHAARTTYRRPVLHGAFSAGLVSRLAGMHLPGTMCLLHSMHLRFIRPIIPPVDLAVEGSLQTAEGLSGRVEVTISDAVTGSRYVEGGYEFSLHETESLSARPSAPNAAPEATDAGVLVTGASGGLGRAVCARLGARAIGVSRSPYKDSIVAPDLAELGEAIGERQIGAIVHCAWPPPDNQRLIRLGNIRGAVEHNIAGPLRDVVSLAQLLHARGTDDAALILVGSTAADPGRHNYRMPLYTLSKALVGMLSRVLSVELADTTHRCIAVRFDVLDGGMNKQLSPAIRAMHADRAPSGRLPTMDEAAEQIAWVLDNRSFLISGSTIDLTGSAIP